MADDELPPCGIYRTRAAIGGIEEGRLVYFHNHGDPGPGLYLPESWRGNRARFQARGHTMHDLGDVRNLEPLAVEGFYRVARAFECCAKRCRTFETNSLVQLGYDGAANAILFIPQWVDGHMAIPDRGTRVEPDRLASLEGLHVPVTDTPLHVDQTDDVFLH